MSTKQTRTKMPRTTFAGVTFAHRPASRHGTITVPRPALRKIVASGKVTCRCTGHYTDDYAWDAAANYGKADGIDPAIARDFADSCRKTVCVYLDTETGVLHVGASWKHYELRETSPAPLDPHAEEIARIEAWIG